MMNDSDVVVASTIAATGLAVLADILEGEPTMTPVVGGFIAGTILLMVAMVTETWAGIFALLILTTSILANGSTIAKKVGGRLS